MLAAQGRYDGWPRVPLLMLRRAHCLMYIDLHELVTQLGRTLQQSRLFLSGLTLRFLKHSLDGVCLDDDGHRLEECGDARVGVDEHVLGEHLVHGRRRREHLGHLLGERVGGHPVRPHQLPERSHACRHQKAAESAERLREVGGRLAQRCLRFVLELQHGRLGERVEAGDRILVAREVVECGVAEEDGAHRISKAPHQQFLELEASAEQQGEIGGKSEIGG
mmetsp:Transcript_37679/g.88122  ORF Transcript_37679/g.88122 Transcript_37679/m.88122 type:complete len:221 (-) Transcript_37679:1674-2336(-)